MNSSQKTDLLIHVFMCGLMVVIQIPSNMLTMVDSGGNHLFRRNYFFQFGLNTLLELMYLPAFGN